MKKTFYSNGKLLLTAEYLVLDGAEALAIPAKYGQYLEVEEIPEKLLVWKSLDEDGKIWFETKFIISGEGLLLESETTKLTDTLLEILKATKKLNPDFLSGNHGYQVTTKLNFNRSWGLGTSSTLITNIAQWAEVNAFVLLQNSFGGSGYDIACALYNNPIVYSNATNPPKIKEVSLNWDFKDKLFFVYLNRKQDSKEAIAKYRGNAKKKEAAIKEVNILTSAILKSSSLLEFETLLEKHEELLSEVLGQRKIKELHFPDYPGKIKSLGGWGGDFVLATRKEAQDYFRLKGLEIVIPFTAMLK